MLALGVLDLPFDAPKHESKIADGRMTILAGGPMVVFHKEILPAAAAPAGQAPALLVSQAFFRNGDRYRMEGNVKFDKYITTEFSSVRSMARTSWSPIPRARLPISICSCKSRKARCR